MNPIKSYREEFHLSQRALASLCGITEQMILKVEQGVFPTLPPKVLAGLSALTNDSVESIEGSYEDWIKRELKTVTLPDTYVMADTAIRESISFKQWMEYVCELNQINPTVNAFCGLIKIHPYVIQKWVAGKMKEVPRQLVERVAYIRGE